MGHKKRVPQTRTKSVSADGHTPVEPDPNNNNLSITETGGSGNTKNSKIVHTAEKSELPVIKLECERALTAVRRGNHNRALKLMKEMSHKFANTALIHRVHGTVCVKVAALLEDPNHKQKNLKNAIESARKAVELSPNSVEFAHFYANLLYEAANDAKEYDEVVQECEKALAIENPVDPAKESLQEETQQKIASAEGRVAFVQNELRSLIQKANIASISTWMKNLGTGEDKFRLIPIRRVAEDPMELKLGQSKRPNEIKKANKTPDERRKEIEVRVAAAKLLQQKSESPNLENEEDRPAKGTGSSSVNGHRGGERRKHGSLRKNESSSERMERVRTYWNLMTIDMKKELLIVKVSDIKAHFGSLKDSFASEVLSEALSFAESAKLWKFWVCCRCGEKFSDSEFHMKHVVQEHMGNLLPKLQSVIPANIDNDWTEMILNSPWKPLDLFAAVEMLKNQSKCQPLLVDGLNVNSHADESEDCFNDAWNCSPGKENAGDTCNFGSIESRQCETYSNRGYGECNRNQGSFQYSLADTWPLSDDPERAKQLEKIHAIFEMLIRHKYLAATHLVKVMQFTMDELQGLVSGSQLLKFGVDQSPMCICFLGAPQLRKILKFLQDLAQSCGLGRYPDKSSNPTDDAIIVSQDLEVKENVILSDDASCLIVDEFLLPVNNVGRAHGGADVYDANALASPDSNALFSWINSGPAVPEQLASWTSTREDKSRLGNEILQMLEKEFYHLQSLCERKCEHMSYEEALQAVEDFCLEESKKRETALESGQSYDSILRRRREELVKNENDILFIGNRFELEAITNVLKEAEPLNANQFGYDEGYAGVTSHLYDLEAGGDDDWRAKDCLHQMNSCIEIAIQRQKEQLSIELSKIDARMMRIVSGMQQMELKLEPVSSHDYLTMLLPLLKSFIQSRLEDLAEKDATEKSDAVREALLAEIELDSKRSVTGGNENQRISQEKSKDKKKSKDYRKTKATPVTDHRAIQYETTEELSSSVASDCEHIDTEITLSMAKNGSRQQEKEIRRKMELEAEERKLEETLEYQRRIEYEAKQKHLAMQQKKSIRLIPEKLEAEMLELHSSANVNGDLHEKLIEQEPLSQKNMLLKCLEDLSRHSKGGAAVTVDSSISGSQETTNTQGLTSGDNLEDGFLSSDRRIGRKGKRRNSVKSPDRKDQVMTSEKKNEFAGIDGCPKSRDSVHSHDINNLGENGAKTLRQLQAEEDEEERFQADLEKAVRQSLEHQAHQKLPFMSKTLSSKPPQSREFDVSLNGTGDENVNGVSLFGTGLKNEVGEYNCFLNVIIQSLWHIRRFRDEFLKKSTSEHVHVGDPCVVCALYYIFTALSTASTDTRKEAVAPTSLRIALSNLYPDSNFFQEAQMNDASEVLAVLFDCLHRSFNNGLGVSGTESGESDSMTSWDCVNKECIAHSLFGMNIFEQMNCRDCHLESRRLKYTSFFHNINASSLRMMKVMCADNSFDELLNFVEMNHQLACDPEAGGCGKPNYIHHILSSPPHVFTTVLGWQNTCESSEDITATLSALSTDIDIGVLYRGLDRKNSYSLVSVVCYYGQHYHCFAFSHEQGQWLMYDDKTVKVIGSWDEVLDMCKRGHLQPQVLFFETCIVDH